VDSRSSSFAPDCKEDCNMGSVESCPVLSQAKSLVQVMTFDLDGSLETQSIFIKRCVGVSQVNSLVRVCAAGVCRLVDDFDGVDDQLNKAREAQVECADDIGVIINYIPVVGHLKAGAHYLNGDAQDATDAVTSATHTTVQIIGCVAGTAAGVGPTAVFILGWAGWSVGGVASDSVISEVCGEPQGVVKSIDEIVNRREETDASAIFSVSAQILLM